MVLQNSQISKRAAALCDSTSRACSDKRDTFAPDAVLRAVQKVPSFYIYPICGSRRCIPHESKGRLSLEAECSHPLYICTYIYRNCQIGESALRLSIQWLDMHLHCRYVRIRSFDESISFYRITIPLPGLRRKDRRVARSFFFFHLLCKVNQHFAGILL